MTITLKDVPDDEAISIVESIIRRYRTTGIVITKRQWHLEAIHEKLERDAKKETKK